MRKLALIAASLLLAGCSTTAQVDNMIASADEKPSGSSELQQSIYVDEVSGGQRIHPLLIFRVENDGFRNALKASLKSRNLLCEQKTNCKYRLDSKIVSFHIPAFTIDAKVTSKVSYQLTSTATNRSKTFDIEALYIATWQEYLHAPTRPLKGAEGSVKKNIGQFIDQLTAIQNPN